MSIYSFNVLKLIDSFVGMRTYFLFKFPVYKYYHIQNKLYITKYFVSKNVIYHLSVAGLQNLAKFIKIQLTLIMVAQSKVVSFKCEYQKSREYFHQNTKPRNISKVLPESDLGL